jgi:phytanoyl-CoA hydroxylase
MMESSVPVADSGAVLAARGHAPHGRFSAEELAYFEQHGFVIAKQLADADICAQMLECTRAALAAPSGPLEYEADLHYPGAPGSRTAAGGNTVRRLKEVQSRHPVFTRFVSQPSLVRRLQQLLGPQVVMPLAHHNCVMTKRPRYSSETGWHQDIRYWSYERPELVSVWLALGRETPDNGCLYLIPDTHTLPVSRDRLDDALFLRADLAENAALVSQKVPAALEPGDVLFFHCRTFHAAGRNQTSETKYSAVFTFRPLDNPPKPGSRSAAMPELLLPVG